MILFSLLAAAFLASAAAVTTVLDNARGAPAPPNQPPAPSQDVVKVLSQHVVVYSDPPVDTKYRSSSRFDPRGMQHVYSISHLFLDLIRREDVLPPGLNASEVLLPLVDQRSGAPVTRPLVDHWEELLLQYIGVVTVATCGLLLALAAPVACFFTWCCRCAGKCGAYPEHFDRRGDACKRFFLGVLLALFVIAAMFGVVCAFVTSFFTYNGMRRLPDRVETSVSDAGLYLDNTGREINTLLVTNFDELEEVLNRVLDESGPILKRSLAEVTQAVAIDDLTDIVSNLGNVKSNLRDIQTRSQMLQGNVTQLMLGLNGTRTRLLAALLKCSSNKVCKEFLSQYNVSRDLAVTADFSDLPTKLPNVTLLMNDITELMENDIESKVRGGQRQLDRVKVDIERSIGDIRPKIKEEIRQMGERLSDQATELQALLSQFEGHVTTVETEVGRIDRAKLDEYSGYLFYIGLGMSFMLLLVFVCHVFGLFYGFCGQRPGNVYGDDCCNTGTGANWLLAAVYLTFLFSCVLLVVATAQFLVGSTVDKVGCDALRSPNDSDVFQLLDQRFVQPVLESQRPHRDWVPVSLSQVITDCHRDLSIYQVLRVEDVYDVSELRNWRRDYGISEYIANLKRKIRLDDLKGIQILSPEAEAELRDLAKSQISDLNFSNYAKLLEETITSVDLNTFISRLRQLRHRLTRSQASLVGPAIDNEAMFLDGMQRVVMNIKTIMKNLVVSVRALEREAKRAKPSFREVLDELIARATKATRFLREQGPELVDSLTNKYVNETTALIDEYVDRVVEHTHGRVGRCKPLSNSYNATVIALCNQIVDPFNGVWTSVGWCLMFFLPGVALAMSLVSLYRKSEPYPGPLVETIPSEESLTQNRQPPSKGKKRRGHRRNASEYLPDSAHYRAGYSYQDRENRFRDMAPRNYSDTPPTQPPQSQQGATAAAASTSASAGATAGPPRYSSNPNLDIAASASAPAPAEYERPPPYYLPGALPAVTSEAPPPLPAPNRP